MSVGSPPDQCVAIVHCWTTTRQTAATTRPPAHALHAPQCQTTAAAGPPCCHPHATPLAGPPHPHHTTTAIHLGHHPLCHHQRERERGTWLTSWSCMSSWLLGWGHWTSAEPSIPNNQKSVIEEPREVIIGAVLLGICWRCSIAWEALSRATESGCS